MLDLQGKLIEQENENAIAGQNDYQLEMSNKPAGIYFIKISTDKGIYNNKIVKQ